MIESKTGLGAAADIGADNPWLGLTAYTEEASGYFYGRDRETSDIYRLVKRETLTVLFGQSGLGKTSLLNAGLFPRLRRNDFLPVYIRFDYSDDSPDLIEQIKSSIRDHIELYNVDAVTPKSDETLWEYFHRRDTDFWSDKNKLLNIALVFDQFEEIFTLGRSGELNQQRSRALVSELADLIEGRPSEDVRKRFEDDPEAARAFSFEKQNFKVIFSLREDFLPHLESMREQIRSVMRNRLRLTRMNGLQGLQAVIEPGGDIIDEATAVRLVLFVAGAAVELTISGDEEDQLNELEVEPALLSVVCRELNNIRIFRGDEFITVDLLAGTKSEILSDFYERSVTDLPAGVRVFTEERLLTKSGYRDSVALEEVLEVEGASYEVVDTLVNRRLLRIEERFGVKRVELTHDILTEVIQTSRDKRREDERLAAETRQAEELRKKLWRARMAVGFFAVLLILMIGALVTAYMARNEAKAALRKVAATKAGTNALAGHNARLRYDWGAALLHYQRSLKQADNLSARIGLSDLLNSYMPQIVKFKTDFPIIAAGFSKRGLPVVFTRGNMEINIIDAASWKKTGKISTNDSKTVAAAYNSDKDLLAYTGSDGVINIRKSENGDSVRVIEGRGPKATALAFSSDGAFLMVGYADNSAELIQTSDGKKTEEYTAFPSPPILLTFSPENDAFAAGFENGDVIFWNIKTGGDEDAFKGHNGRIVSLSFDSSGRKLVSTAEDGRAIVWDCRSRLMVSSFLKDPVRGSVVHAGFSNSGLFFVTREKSISVFDYQTEPWTLLTEIGVKPETAGRTVISPGGLLLMSYRPDGAAGVWQTSGLELIRGAFRKADAKSVSLWGDFCAVISEKGELKIFNLESKSNDGSERKEIFRFTPDSAKTAIEFAAVSRGNDYLAFARSDNAIVLWHEPTGDVSLLERQDKQRLSTKGPSYNFTERDKRMAKMARLRDIKPAALAFDPSGARMAAVSEAGTIRIWDLKTLSQSPSIIRRPTTGVRCAAFGPGGLIAVGEADGDVIIHDSSGVKEASVLKGHKGPVLSIDISPDGKMLASASTDNTVRVWDVETQAPLAVCTGHSDAVNKVVFSKSGKVFITGSDDGTIRFWDIQDQGMLAMIKAGTAVKTLSYDNQAGNGEQLYIAGSDSTVFRRKLYLLSPVPEKNLFTLSLYNYPFELDAGDQPVLIEPWRFSQLRLEAALAGALKGAPEGGKPFSGLLKNEIARARKKMEIEALREAVINRNADRVANLIEKGIDADTVFMNGYTPLTLALNKGYGDITAVLINKGADVNFIPARGKGPLETAIGKGRGGDVNQLLKAGADAAAIFGRALNMEDHKTINLLMSSGMDPDETDHRGYTRLHKAAREGDVSRIKILLSLGVEIEKKGPDGSSALLYAVGRGHKSAAEFLINNGADLEAKNKPGQSPLNHAAAMGQEAMVRLLLGKGADLLSTDKRGRTPLVTAVRHGRTDIIKTLLLIPTQVNVLDRNGWSLLMHAARGNRVKTAQYLIETGADVNSLSRDGDSALLLACKYGSKNMVELLLSKGADIQVKDENGWSPLMHAAGNGAHESVLLLLEKGGNQGDKTRSGETLLMLAARSGSLETVEILLRKKARLDEQDRLGWTPLHHAAAAGKEKMVKYLIQAGAESSARSLFGETPLIAGASGGNAAVIREMIGGGASVDEADNQGATALMHAAALNRKEAAELLIKLGARVNLTDNQGWSALMYAAPSGGAKLINLLLAAGAEIEVKDNLGRTPVRQAELSGNEKAAELLNAAGPR